MQVPPGAVEQRDRQGEAESAGSRSVWPSAQGYSISTFFPSISQPHSAPGESCVDGPSMGTLKLDDPASFAGTVAGMTGQDTIDFADIDPAKVQPPSYDPANGTLHVTDGAVRACSTSLCGEID
jgi:hypothetical protein